MAKDAGKVSKVLGSIPGEVTKILPECWRLVISVSLCLGDTFSTGTTRAAYGNVLIPKFFSKAGLQFWIRLLWLKYHITRADLVKNPSMSEKSGS